MPKKTVQVDGMPLLPGYTFYEQAPRNHHKPKMFYFNKGYPRCTNIISEDSIGGGKEGGMNQLQQLSKVSAELTYGRGPAQVQQKDYSPVYSTMENQKLTFLAYSKETRKAYADDAEEDNEEEEQSSDIQTVRIDYNLLEGKIALYDVVGRNTLLAPRAVPKNANGDHYHWMDFNIGAELCMFHRKYHIVDCDEFTRRFYEAEGILIGEPQQIPERYPTDEEMAAKKKVDYEELTLDKLCPAYRRAKEMGLCCGGKR